jgi:hypothetical protein
MVCGRRLVAVGGNWDVPLHSTQPHRRLGLGALCNQPQPQEQVVGWLLLVTKCSKSQLQPARGAERPGASRRRTHAETGWGLGHSGQQAPSAHGPRGLPPSRHLASPLRT